MLYNIINHTEYNKSPEYQYNRSPEFFENIHDMHNKSQERKRQERKRQERKRQERKRQERKRQERKHKKHRESPDKKEQLPRELLEYYKQFVKQPSRRNRLRIYTSDSSDNDSDQYEDLQEQLRIIKRKIRRMKN